MFLSQAMIGVQGRSSSWWGHGLGEPRCQEQGAGNCPKGTEMTGKIHLKQPWNSAGMLHPQMVQVGLEWEQILIEKFAQGCAQGVQISRGGNLTAPLSEPLLETEHQGFKEGFGNFSFSLKEIRGIAVPRGLLYHIF